MASNQFPPDYKKTREEIIEHLKNSDVDAAYKVIRNILDYPGPKDNEIIWKDACLLYTSPSPRDRQRSRMPSSA